MAGDTNKAESDASTEDESDPWLNMAVSTWIKNHGGVHSDPVKAQERRDQVRSMLQRSSRRKVLFEKRAAEEERQQACELENAVKAVAQMEEREAAAAECEWDVEELVAKRIENGKTEYRVKWYNYPSSQNTWEPVVARCSWQHLKRR